MKNGKQGHRYVYRKKCLTQRTDKNLHQKTKVLENTKKKKSHGHIHVRTQNKNCGQMLTAIIIWTSISSSCFLLLEYSWDQSLVRYYRKGSILQLLDISWLTATFGLSLSLVVGYDHLSLSYIFSSYHGNNSKTRELTTCPLLVSS